MVRTPGLLLALLPLVLACACGDNIAEESSAEGALSCSADGAACDEAFAQSLTEWLASANDEVGQYTYNRTATAPSGYRITTEVDVEAGVVVARRASGVRPDEATGTLIPFAWEELGGALGARSEGARAVPISTLYEECILDVLSRDPLANEIVFERLGTGELKACTYRPLDCEGSRVDCVFGPAIDVITVAAR